MLASGYEEKVNLKSLSYGDLGLWVSLHYSAVKYLRAPGKEDKLIFRAPKQNAWHWICVNSFLRNREGPDLWYGKSGGSKVSFQR